jgi:alkanesulfonate monooxygenase SsuD/methylene tetrahydromethanopterin reductase-like flavin-dependent oxidoreductase (luciferase family)
MAAHAGKPALSIDVLIVSWRTPLQLASQLGVAQGLSGGRVEISLGAGMKRLSGQVHQAFALPLPPRQERLARVEAFCRVLPAFWRGGCVTDELLRLDDASIAPAEIESPRISIGGASDEILAMIARAADGWSYAQQPDLGSYETRVATLEDAWTRAGRSGTPFNTAQLPVDELDPIEARRMAGDFTAAGGDALTFAFLRDRRPEAVRGVAEAVFA